MAKTGRKYYFLPKKVVEQFKEIVKFDREERGIWGEGQRYWTDLPDGATISYESLGFDIIIDERNNTGRIIFDPEFLT